MSTETATEAAEESTSTPTETTAETTAETTEAVTKPAAKKPATNKPAARKPAAKKPVAKKTAAAVKPAVKKTATRKPATKKTATKEEKSSLKEILSNLNLEESRAKIKESADKAQEKFKESTDAAQNMVKTVVYAQLGVYSMFYDGVTSRLESTRAEMPKQWGQLVKRGEKVQKGLDKSQDELKSKIKSIDLKNGVETFKSSTKDSLGKIKSFAKKAA